MQRNIDRRFSNLPELVKNIVLGFCKINLPHAERLDIYGSLHIRADDNDVANFMLIEHSFSSRASSPTVTSAQSVDAEFEGNNDNLRDGNQKNIPKNTVKTEASVKTEEKQNDADSWQQLIGDSAAVQPQETSLSQPSCSTSQPDSAATDTGNASHDTGAMSKSFIPVDSSNIDQVKCENLDAEAAENADQFSDDGSVVILDDDPADAIQDSECIDDMGGGTEFKPKFQKMDEEYNIPCMYDDDLAQYDDASAYGHQYASASADDYLTSRPRAGKYPKAFGRSASSSGPNLPNASEKTCAYCQETFVSDAELSTHFQQYHQCAMPPMHSQRQKRKTHSFQVDQLPDSYVSVGADESVVQLYKCRFCGKLFRSRDGLSNHENVKHSHNKRYQCNFCSQEFLTRQAAYKHRITFHRLLNRRMQ